jgi:hypothetical protein
MSGVVHIAGVDAHINHRLRQRCAWCGACLIDYDLTNIAVPVGQEDTTPGSWPVGSLVLVDGGMSVVMPHVDGDPLPMEACGRIDPEVTR